MANTEINEEFLDSLSPEEVAGLFATYRDNVRLSKGFATFGGESAESIRQKYEIVRLYLISKLSELRDAKP